MDRVEKKLSNEKFVAKAPAAVVEAERAKGADYQAQRSSVRTYRNIEENLIRLNGEESDEVSCALFVSFLWTIFCYDK